MKLHSLRITAMGPYAETVEVDFDRLDEAGVYLLTGPTGSGKTTVLDAVSYALFGEIPRAAKGTEVVSDHRRIETSPLVVLEATIGGERLRISRSPEHLRKAARGSGTATQNQSLKVDIHRDGEWRSSEGNWRELNSELVERVGMNADQFGQVVMLPQGDFAKFLRASVNERKALLERLFPGADLAWLENWLKQRAISDRQAREEKQQEISDCFQRVHAIAAGLTAEDQEPGPEAPDEAEVLPDLILPGPALKWIGDTANELERIDGEKESSRARAAKEAEQAAKELRGLQEKADLITRRAENEKRKSELEAEADWREKLGREIEAAEKAAGVLTLAQAAREQRTVADRCRDALTEAEAALVSEPLTAAVEREALPELERSFRAEVTTIVNFENETLPRRGVIENRLGELEREISRLDSDGPESAVGQADAALQKARETATVAKNRYLQIRQARTEGMAAELAQSLVEGEPCVVCGSTEHPSPASGEGIEFSREDEQRAETESNQADATAGAAEANLASARTESEQRKIAAQGQVAEFREELARLSEREQELAADSVSVGERRQRLEQAADLISEYLRLNESAKDSREAAEKADRAAGSEASAAGFDSVATALDSARDVPTLDELRSQAAEHDQALAIVAERLNGELAGIDPDQVVDLVPAEEAAKATAVARDQRSAEAGVARSQLETFRRETEPVARLYEELEPLATAAARSRELSRLTGGENERRMKLSIYVLATRLRQVIEAANTHLQRMSDQRYHLVYSGDLVGHGAASGLGIEVHDAQTSKVRATATLSGGESFCASLSLALGLAEIVQRESGGKRLETLFIDEGFGTLDSKSLDQVMDVIDGLREGGRSVGLVSHVEELRNRIPAQIQVLPGPGGSDLQVTTA